MKDALTTVSKNLKRYRSLRDLSQDELAKKVGISRATYTNIEVGKEEPRVSTLQLIANALDVDIFKLFAPIPEITSLRFRSNSIVSTKMKSLQEQVKIEFAYWLKNYNSLEETLTKKIPFALDNAIGYCKEPEAAAKKVREELKITGVINDICGIIENAGIKIFTFNQDDKCGFGFCLNKIDGGPAIAVNISPKITPERKIFTVCHELAHIVLHPNSFENENENEKSEEKEADEFGGYFLMPNDEFVKKYTETYGMHPVDRILFVKRYFKVSYKTVLMRLAKLTNNKEIFKNFNCEYTKKYHRDLKDHAEPECNFYAESFNEPRKLDDLDFKNERLKALVREGIECAKISLQYAAELLSLDLSHMKNWVDEWNAAKENNLEWNF